MSVPSPAPIVISQQSWPCFRSLMSDPAAQPFLVKSLRAIQQDPSGCGRPFDGITSTFLRTDLVELPGDKWLRLLWNPAMVPTEVILILQTP